MTGQLKPYEALAAVYDAWTAENKYDAWADFIHEQLRSALGDESASVLDVCCGTGALTRRLQERGHRVTGVDASERMLEQARVNTAEGTEFISAVLPAAELPGGFQAAICTFDSVNYMSGPGDLSLFLTAVGNALEPSGVFVFDVNTRHKLENVFGSSHYGDDCGDYAYVWRNRYAPDARCVDFLITLFLREQGVFTRHEERHRQRWFSHEEIRAAAAAAGFKVSLVVDDYGDAQAHEASLRETWVLVKPGTS
ncbi:class I SAM-dependent DNA methyltransferase [Streptantibioticus ferralitis]|uniref:Class I SAM-dependent methyltransferase n=1 Tax=Streptantibioticus ferralitis TaxID=236510 RepID=A0ABT5Z1L1_9ACTN|nr:class I SAM-dependent methyltransferase [Streptantibioticus ferralitis]MDF2257722.1 class I SAM-dependent methyltransferase [Streptantibioticus ferralitis]